MIADSSSRLHRGNTGSSLATALRDRGPCVIPVQPNRSLPIRPAPPAPTRALSIAKCRKDSTSTLKLSTSSTLDVELLEPTQPKALAEEAIAKDENEFDLNENNKLDGEIFPRVAANPLTCLLPQISSLVHLAVTKRNYSELDSDLDVSTKTKKRKNSHDADSVLIREEGIDSILKEFVNSSPDTLADEPEKARPANIEDQWSEKGCPGSLGTSSISSGGGKEKDTSNKVPPLRLKKVVREDASHGQEVSVAASGGTWAIPQKSSASISMPQDVSNVEATPPIAQISNASFTDRRRATPPNPSLTSNEQSAGNTVLKLDPPKASPSKPKEASSSSRPAKLQHSAESNLFGRGSMKEQTKSGDAASEISPGYTRNVAANETVRLPDAKERTELVPMNGPVVTSLCNPVEVASTVRYGDIYGSLPSVGTRPRVSTAAVTNILQLQSNYYGSMVARDVLPTGATEDPRNVQKVTSTSNHSTSLDCTHSARSYNQIGSSVPPPSHQCGTLSKINNDEVQSDSTRKTDGSRIMAEQFPTLGNWVARMSKKYVSKSKTKVQGAAAIPTATAEETKRAPVREIQKEPIGSGSNVPRNVMNIAPQWNTERWQRHQRQQQRQQQQLLQQVATVAAPAQPLSGAPSSRSGMCPPISMSQFYPNNYGIDPYANAFGYHPAVYPYSSSYPYHPRLHPGPPISTYQIPMQDTLTGSLRPMQHVDKRLPSIQDPTRQFTTDLLKYSGSLSSTGFQHPNAVDFERLRTAAATHTTGTTGCLPQLLLPSAPMQSSSQATTLSRASPSSYSSGSSQFGRRMLPDMVAAAAAAAVVAAASFGRQRDPLASFARPAAEAATSVAGIISGETGQLGSAGRAVNSNREHVSSVQQPGNIVNSSDEIRLNNNSYHQLQSLLLDGLPFVRTDGNIGQQASTFSNNMQNANAPAVASSAYKISSIGSSRVPPLKDIARACETPHLGKVNRNPDNPGNLMCSNCGLAGSMFKCLGCEAAFYCDENCQARHWTVHVERCPKKMPKLKKVT